MRYIGSNFDYFCAVLGHYPQLRSRGFWSLGPLERSQAIYINWFRCLPYSSSICNRLYVRYEVRIRKGHLFSRLLCIRKMYRKVNLILYLNARRQNWSSRSELRFESQNARLWLRFLIIFQKSCGATVKCLRRKMATLEKRWMSRYSQYLIQRIVDHRSD